MVDLQDPVSWSPVLQCMNNCFLITCQVIRKASLGARKKGKDSEVARLPHATHRAVYFPARSGVKETQPSIPLYIIHVQSVNEHDVIIMQGHYRYTG